MGFRHESRLFLGWKIKYENLIKWLKREHGVDDESIKEQGVMECIDEEMFPCGWMMFVTGSDWGLEDNEKKYHLSLVFNNKMVSVPEFNRLYEDSDVQSAMKLAEELRSDEEYPSWYSKVDVYE